MSVPQRQVRLPHLAKLRVKSALPKKTGGPCNVTLTNLLSCWASNAQGAPVCAGLEQELKACMATRTTQKAKKSTINYHAARLQNKINPPPHD
ncbi:hypothetical protein DV454_004379 [Geotrichum candidum]|uniref:Similar to Saccharomyces cerevisiae YDL045W-A MRP10 Mitochondrial ribosomal protein of the small subunit n=1 Tax=Geotrichum candidum TaxID=1173061 RepID=A0A0J9XJ82_GEOCN|nr:hypothetical protein DV454_004379 [Geotrichum candidum]CDO57371.1 similar to Saccharomyces cerevisiae YDL045W-A MRP10 Mitochondrial ribosomal protein of the small subunit [Geotrichum candidum]